MRRHKAAAVLALVLILAGTSDLKAAMSDSAAMAKAQALWGTKALILQCRFPTDTYWTKQVGYFDTQIRIMGSGANTWDAAFAAVSPTNSYPVCGAAAGVAQTPPNLTIQPFSQDLIEGMGFTFTLQRDGPTDQPLTVNYFLGNSATPGVDYIPDPGGRLPNILTATIPQGSASQPMHFQSLVGSAFKFVTLQIQPGNYKLAANNSANAGFYTAASRPDLPATAPPALNAVPIGEPMVLRIPGRP